MQHVPSWIINLIEKEELVCHKCNGRFKMAHLMSLGVQKSSQIPHHEMISIGMFCNKCREMTIFEIREMSLVEFAFEIIQPEDKDKVRIETESENEDEERKVSPSPKKLVKAKSKITAKEVQDCVKFLNSIKTHEEFLIAIGMSPEDIKKYSFIKENACKSNKKGRDKGEDNNGK